MLCYGGTSNITMFGEWLTRIPSRFLKRVGAVIDGKITFVNRLVLEDNLPALKSLLIFNPRVILDTDSQYGHQLRKSKKRFPG